jgi:hypothetical protein
MDTVTPEAQATPFSDTGESSSQVFVDASGRRARRMTRCGYLLGVSCVGYIGMVALGLSGTRVAALPGVPTSAENEIIAGLSGEGGSIGLHLTRAPVVAARPVPGLLARPAPTRATEVHEAALRSAAARSATLSARAALAKGRTPLVPSGQAGALTGRPTQQSAAYPQSTGSEQVLAESGAPADPSDPTESKSQERAEAKAAQKAQAKQSKQSKQASEYESY